MAARSRRLTIVSMVAIALLIVLCALSIFIFSYGYTHYDGTRGALFEAQYLLTERGDIRPAFSRFVDGVHFGFEGGIRWLAAEPYFMLKRNRFKNGNKQGALEACRQAQAIIGSYDYAGELEEFDCGVLQQMVDFELQCAQDCTSDHLCEFTPACAP